MAENYARILLAIDLGEHSELVAERAKQLAASNSASITLLHVVEFVPVEPMGEALLPPVAVDEELQAASVDRLKKFADKVKLADVPQIVRVGSIKSEIVTAAHEEKSDIVVLGSRERHGLAILVNRTEDTVMHAAPCDVLAVRLPG